MLTFFKRKSDSDTVEITLSNRTILRILALVILSIMLLAALSKARHALILIGTGLFLTLALNAPVSWLANRLPGKRRGNRTVATGISFLVVMALLITFLASIVPPLVSQTSNFISAAPGLVEDVRSEDNTVGRFVRRYHLEPQIDKLANQLSDRLDNVAGSAFSTFTRIGSSIFSTLAILVLAFMMLTEGKNWLKFFEKFIPKEKLPAAERLSADMYSVIKGYVNGQVLLASIAAFAIVVPLFALDISYPIALMVIVFIAGLIPLVGHTIGIFIVTLVALFNSLGSAAAIFAFYVIYQQIENYVLQPRIQANSTNMSPLLVFVSVILGVSFGGLFGGLVAIPLAGCLRVFILHYLEATPPKKNQA